MEFKKPSNQGWTIYTKSKCEFCVKVKDLLNLHNCLVETIESDKYIETFLLKMNFLSDIKDLIGFEYYTFPIVFLNGKFIGGFVDTQKYFDKLDKLDKLEKFDITDDF